MKEILIKSLAIVIFSAIVKALAYDEVMRNPALFGLVELLLLKDLLFRKWVINDLEKEV